MIILHGSEFMTNLRCSVDRAISCMSCIKSLVHESQAMLNIRHADRACVCFGCAVLQEQRSLTLQIVIIIRFSE